MASLLDKYKKRGWQSENKYYGKKPEQQESFTEKEQRIKNELKNITEKFKKGFPLTENCRVDFESDFFSKQKSKRDKNIVKSLKIKFERNKKGRLNKGEKLESLKTVIFDKFLENDFYVFRSSEYDDYVNGVDNVLIHKESGETICAFDEVISEKDNPKKIKEKIKKICQINREKGAKLKYGFRIEGEEILPAQLEEIPVFYLSLPRDNLRTAIKNFGHKRTDQKVFNVFIKKLNKQTKELKKINNQDKKWRTRLRLFSKALEEKLSKQ